MGRFSAVGERGTFEFGAESPVAGEHNGLRRGQEELPGGKDNLN